MALAGQNQLVLVVTAFAFLVPGLVGVVAAWEGTGRALWFGATAALALTTAGLTVFTTPHASSELPYVRVIVGLDLSALGVLVAIGTCADALTRSLRAHHFAWFVALLLTAAVPLVAAIVVFDIGVLVIGPAHPGQPVNDQLDRLVFELLPIGPAALTVYGVWTASAVWRARGRVLARRSVPSGQVRSVPAALGLAVPAWASLRTGALLGREAAGRFARRLRRLGARLLVGRDVLDEGTDGPR
jgi:hypothetical protein